MKLTAPGRTFPRVFLPRLAACGRDSLKGNMGYSFRSLRLFVLFYHQRQGCVKHSMKKSGISLWEELFSRAVFSHSLEGLSKDGSVFIIK